jgi:type I restriction enzyme M protein
MGSQGDAGQFRTPRHIIDFMVEIVNPKKDEEILDPSCGTAGFLISSYKHILNSNTKDKQGDLLSAEERKKVGQNLVGYDISPDMTRIALVNMYLHRFANPEIHEYDTLSSEDRWNEYFDVILANPPFFSPTGGITPHDRFGVKSTRAEVLFVDYIMEHLKPKGRAGIIVPEGIIFQTGTAYKTLRKQLVESSLVGVISLPAGVFQPYSGVKTSILILDKELNQKSDSIFFAKVENDGFSLTAKRTDIEKNDLPNIKEQILKFFHTQEVELLNVSFKTEILSNPNVSFSLSFSNKLYYNSDFQTIPIGEVCDLYQPQTITQKDLVDDGEYLVYGANGVIGRYDKFNHKFPEVLVTCRGNTCGTLNLSPPFSWITGNAMVCSPKDEDNLDKKYLYFVLQNTDLSSVISGSAQPQITRTSFQTFEIPLPPIEVQQEIVDELEGYQKIIDGCRQVVENYKPTIDIDPSWEMVELGEHFDFLNGYAFRSSDFVEQGIQLVRMGNVKQAFFDKGNKPVFLPRDFCESSKKFLLGKGNIIISMTGTTGKEDYGNVCRIDDGNIFLLNQRVGKFITKSNEINEDFFFYFCQSNHFRRQLFAGSSGGVRQANISGNAIKLIKIPVPDFSIQEIIVERIKIETDTIEGNKKLIEIYTQKIEDRISKVWGEGNDSNPSIDKMLAEVESGVNVYPKKWYEFFNFLKSKLPPNTEISLPFILGGSGENDYNKNQRFKEHLRIAEENGVIDEIKQYISSFSEDDWERSEGNLDPNTPSSNDMIVEDVRKT